MTPKTRMRLWKEVFRSVDREVYIRVEWALNDVLPGVYVIACDPVRAFCGPGSKRGQVQVTHSAHTMQQLKTRSKRAM